MSGLFGWLSRVVGPEAEWDRRAGWVRGRRGCWELAVLVVAVEEVPLWLEIAELADDELGSFIAMAHIHITSHCLPSTHKWVFIGESQSGSELSSCQCHCC